MRELSLEQRQQITDYYLGLLDEADARQVQELLAESVAAKDFIKRVEANLKPLDCLPEPEAPGSLVSLTLARVNSAAALERQEAGRLPRFEDTNENVGTSRPRLLRFPELVTIAASIALLAGLFIPALRQWQLTAIRQNCAFQQASIGSAMRSYAADHNGDLPYLPEKVGNSWMRPRRTGPKRTDTSNLFLLIKKGYAKSKIFICPGVKHKAEALEYAAAGLDDFPLESLVSYSYQNMFGMHRPKSDSPDGFVVLADRNPLLKLGPRPTVSTVFLTDISPNHGKDRGHNVLRINWSVSWSTTANAGYNGDNIWRPADFTGNDRAGLQGKEVPSSREDSFLGP